MRSYRGIRYSMKKIILTLSVFTVIVLALCACGTGNKDNLWDIGQYENSKDIISIEKLDLGQIIPEGVAVSNYKVIYQVDDCTVVSYLSVPNACIEEQTAYPCIIYNRGGNRDYGANQPEYIAYLAESSGKIIFASQYRGVDGGTGTEEFGGADLKDVLKLIDFCEEFAFINMEQLYMMGETRGGMMTYMACREDSRIKKAVIISGIADAIMSYEERSDMGQVLKKLIGGTPKNEPMEYEKRSAVYWADEIKCPVLIIHSKLDERVSFEQARKMVAALEETGKEYKFVSYEDGVHGLHPEDFSIIMEWCQK